MFRYIVLRVLHSVPAFFVATVVAFLLLRFVPGDPAVIYTGFDSRPEEIEAVREAMGLNRPLYIQYGAWLIDLLQFDLGRSFVSRLPVTDLIQASLGPTLELAVVSFIFAGLTGLVTGVVSAVKPGRLIDGVIGVINSVALSVPGFWIGILLLLFVVQGLGWFAAGGRVPPSQSLGGWAGTIILPPIALSIRSAAVISRFTRNQVLDILHNDYIEAVVAKGATPWRVLMYHAVPNALPPVITIGGLEFARLVGSAVVIETVFSWPGIGRLLIVSLAARDYLVVQAAILLFVAAYIIANLAADVAQLSLDPRLRQSTFKRPAGVK